MKLSPDSYQQILGVNNLYEGGFVLPAGKYKLKVGTRENESEHAGDF